MIHSKKQLVRALVRPILAALTVSALACTQIGCGGGSSSNTTSGGSSSAALTGRVTAPASQQGRAASGAHTRATDAVGDPVSGATVTLIDLDTSSAVGTPVTTGTDGTYSFPSVPAGKNCRIEAVKGALTLTAIVTTPTDTTAPASAPVNLDPITTIVAKAAEAKLNDLKTALGTDSAEVKQMNLQAMADDIKKSVPADQPIPDCTKPIPPETIQTVSASAAPKGTYFGEAVDSNPSKAARHRAANDTMKLGALIDEQGRFFLLAFNPNAKNNSSQNGQNNGSQNGSNGSGSNSGTSSPGGTSNPSNGNGSNGNGSTGNGNNGGNGSQNQDNGDGFATGTIDPVTGVLTGETNQGKVKIRGLFTNGIGVGTWVDTESGGKGTWKLQLIEKSTDYPYTGLYAGKHSAGLHDGQEGNFAVLVLADHTAYVIGNGIIGTGTVDNSGNLTFNVDGNGQTIIATGLIDATSNTISGNWSASENGSVVDTGTFQGNRADPFALTIRS